VNQTMSQTMNLTKSKTKPEFQYKVIRTDRRKTASIKVSDGKVKFIIPKNLSDKRLQSLIQKKTPWILKKLNDLSKIKPVKPKEYISGESFTYLGRNYRLKLIKNDPNIIKLKGGQFILSTNENFTANEKNEFVKQELLKWFISHAERRLKEKTRRFSKIIGVEPKSVKVKYFKSRWGSCTSKGDISFNWKIIIAPHRIVDYVVVHELSHLLHHNHSERFWKTVQQIIPDCYECRTWLKDFGESLII